MGCGIIYLFIYYLLVSPYYNTQNYNKNKNNIHEYGQSDRNSVSQWTFNLINKILIQTSLDKISSQLERASQH
jgi:hypothetical protein